MDIYRQKGGGKGWGDKGKIWDGGGGKEEEKHFDLYLSSYMKINSKFIDLKVKP